MDTQAVMTALSGGALIGSAASALLLLDGRIAGISGIVGGLLPPRRGDASWRLAFLSGLVAGGFLLLHFARNVLPLGTASSLSLAAVAGVLVGVGTGIGNGCTSGHGVCGLSRRSPRSLAATLTFMGTGALTVFVVRHLLGVARP